MKTIKLFSLTAFAAVCIATIINGCATTEAIKENDGSVLWSENCMRCHNTPSPTDFNDSQWEVVGTHMKLRANLTEDETKKIIEFLQSAN